MDDYSEDHEVSFGAETIAAISTPNGYGGVGVVRVSGPLASAIGKAITKKTLPSRQAVYSEFLGADDSSLDLGLALFFGGPNSFTGEDVLELQGHGGPVVLDSVLARALELGARMARPGEFSERAFLNNKMDLVQAEAVASLIAAQSAAAAKAAIRSLQGDFSKIIHVLVEELIQLRQFVEAAIDFSEEDLSFLAEGKIHDGVIALQKRLRQILQQAHQGALLEDGVKTVLVGRTNAGKSSLLNLLAGEDTAIVTDIPGTTRDLLKVAILLDGVKLELIDTAGLRDTEDVIEQEGVRRAWGVIEKAELIMLVTDSAAGPQVVRDDLFLVLKAKASATAKIVVVYNKIDLLVGTARVETSDDVALVHLSAKTGEGIDLLRDTLKKVLGIGGNTEAIFIARRRHLLAIEQALNCFARVVDCLHTGGKLELVAEDLRLVQQALGKITGEFSSEDLLGRIFSEFCIGK